MNYGQTIYELLAESLTRAEKKAREGVVRSNDISRRDRERLLKSGWLQQIITGWYLLVSPQAREGESTVWFASFWIFLQQYLRERFDQQYCLSAESSLDIHTANNVIPQQVVIITKTGGNYTLPLPHQTSLVIYQDAKNFPVTVEKKDELQLMPVNLALCRATKSFFQRQPMNAKIALLMIRDPSELTRYLLQGGMVQSAARLAGAYSQMGREEFSQAIIHTMKSAGFEITKENNPLNPAQVLSVSNNARITSPYHARIISMWETMREDILKHFHQAKSGYINKDTIIKRINDVYVNDAYNSLSIEGYQVTKTLLEKIKTGQWNPDHNESDFQQRNTLAAKGYYLAFLAVKESIINILDGAEVASVIKSDLSKWYQALFLPSVDAKVIDAVHLAGYRNDRVFIRNSLHTPPPKEAALDCMDAFFTCLRREDNPIVRTVLGHFIFVFIHPYMDGNGRMGRFLMNTLWIAGGYPWTIVRMGSRPEYMQALELASVSKNIIPFTDFLANEMSVKW